MTVEQQLPVAGRAGSAQRPPPLTLRHDEVAGYALAQGLIEPAQIVAGGLVVRDLSSRNRVYAVESDSGPSWLLKQGIGATGTGMVANEARAYAALHTLAPTVRRHLATWRGYDERRGILALGLVPKAHSLRTVNQRRRRAPIAVARGLGRALGNVHRASMQATQESAPPQAAPEGLFVHRPGIELLREGSSAAIELVKIIQQTPGFVERLEELRLAWRPRALVHMDIKWDNCLVSATRNECVLLIDWEAARMGDPCWDIGSALSHYLGAWVFSIPVTGQTPPERFAALADRPLAGLQPAIRACWAAYTAALEPAGVPASAWLLPTVRYAAARLVVTAFETAQASAQLTAPLMLHLQLALNMLERPHEAAVHLLGLPLEPGSPA